MKNIIFTLYALSFFAVSDIFAQHNADWPFYIAFEDATGAKDTVWFVMDQEATNGADEFLNEVPVTLDENVFNVWTYVTDNENLYKVSARPLNGFTEGLIFANNYYYPITASWDSSLFDAQILYDVLGYGVNKARLENEYFWGVFNNPLIWNIFDMLITDHAEMPWFWWGSHDHFPITLYISCGEKGLAVTDVWRQNLNIYPNPASDRIYVKSEEPLRAVKIYDLSGRIVNESDLSGSFGEDVPIDLSSIHAAGMYFVSFELFDGRLGVKKFLKE